MTTITIPTQVRFGNLVKAESRKYVNTRAALVLSILTATALAVATLGAIAAYPDLAKVATGTDLLFLPLAVTSMLAAVIVILPVTSEWTQRGALTTFVVEPRRERVVAAKALVTLGVVLAVWLACQLSWAVFNAAGAAVHGLEASWEFQWAHWFGSLGVFLLDVTVAFTLALLLRNTALTIAAFMAIPVMLETLGLFGQLPAKIVSWIKTPGVTLQTMLSAPTHAAETGQQLSQTTLWSHFAVGVIVWIVVPLAIGLWLNHRAEAK